MTITATVATTARTGVEMEALTAVAVAALNVYDMVKGIDRDRSSNPCGCCRRTRSAPATDAELR